MINFLFKLPRPRHINAVYDKFLGTFRHRVVVVCYPTHVLGRKNFFCGCQL
jgi:hypothetical protein